MAHARSVNLPKYNPVFFGQQYYKKLLTIQRADLIAFWPMWEASGSISYDFSGNSRNGAYTGVTLGQTGIGDGRTSPYFDGANDVSNVYNAGFTGAFSTAAGSLSFWINPYVWSDGLVKYFVLFEADANNYFRMQKNPSNQLCLHTMFGGVWKGVSYTTTIAAWVNAAITWDINAGPTGQVKCYLNGSQIGTTQTNLGTWAGSLSSNYVCIGAYGVSSPVCVFNGCIAHVAVWTTALTAGEIAKLAVV